MWDNETYKDSNYIAHPYACAYTSLNKLKQALGDKINSEDNVPDDLYNRLISEDFTKVFTGEDCIIQMLRRLGEINSMNITLIAHNGSGFDNYLVLRNYCELHKVPIITPRGILTLTVKNIHA